MLEFRTRYLELKKKAKELLLEGKTSEYLKLLIEMEQMNLILVKIKN